MLDDEDASQEDVDEALSELQSAVDGLEIDYTKSVTVTVTAEFTGGSGSNIYDVQTLAGDVDTQNMVRFEKLRFSVYSNDSIAKDLTGNECTSYITKEDGLYSQGEVPFSYDSSNNYYYTIQYNFEVSLYDEDLNKNKFSVKLDDFSTGNVESYNENIYQIDDYTFLILFSDIVGIYSSGHTTH